MTHTPVGRPFVELDLRHQLGLHPLYRFVGLGFIDEVAVPGLEGLHQLVSLRQTLMIKTTPGMCNIMELAVAVEANNESTEIFA